MRLKKHQHATGNNSLRLIESQFSKKTNRIRTAILASLLFLTSCGSNRETLFKEITEFNKSIQVGAESIAAYYSSINEQELKLYLLILELNPNCEAGDYINYQCLKANFKPSGKKEDLPFSPLKQPAIPLESIQLRIALLKELADYSKSIANLAGDDSAEKFQGNTKTLQTRLISLEKKFNLLQSKSSSSTPDSNIATNYLKPITTIIAILGKISLQEAKWSEIRKSIIEAETSVNTVLTSIGSDLDTYAYPLIIVGADARYSLLISYYNRNSPRFSQAERSSILNKISEYKKTYDLAAINQPSKIPNDILEAHKSLVKLAKSDGSIKDIAELKSWLEKFKEDAEQIKEAVNQLNQISGKK